MTYDVIALTPTMPDTKALLAALHAGGPDLRVSGAADGAVAQLCGADGQPLVSIEAPRFLQLPGEAGRLLGHVADMDPAAPMWWTEVRGTSAVAESRRLAGSVAGRLTAVLGGATWPRDAAHTDVVTVPAADPAAKAAIGHGGIDVLTAKAALVIHDRPVAAATTWLTDVIRFTTGTGRELHLITPPSTRLTFPLRTLLDHIPGRWVVQDPEHGYRDGLTGSALAWNDAHFTPSPNPDGRPCIAPPSELPRADGESEHQLVLSLRTIHPATDQLVLGGALECAWQMLTGAMPAGWSTAEPVNLPWSRSQLTALARDRARSSTPTWLVVVGAPERPAIATIRIAHTRAGIEEHITLALGHTASQRPPLDVLPKLADALADRHNLATMVTELRAARADLTAPAHYEPPSAPISFTLGPHATADLGFDRTRRALADLAPVQLGPAARPALHFTLGDSTDPSAWQSLHRVSAYLNASRSPA
ncbi:DUF6177 family protein [Streptomyces sp. NPDC056682]|uniref:DUF6177 family protein n=1 Tax=Streptomyces sp. NPDC056682 TaxID=3345909 RepID=UPI0036B4A411